MDSPLKAQGYRPYILQGLAGNSVFTGSPYRKPEKESLIKTMLIRFACFASIVIVFLTIQITHFIPFFILREKT